MSEGSARRQRPPAADDDSARRIMIENAPVCIHRIDRDGRFLALNRAGLAMLGVEDLATARRSTYLEWVAARERERVRSLIQRAFGGEGSEFEFTAVDGRVFASSFEPLEYDGSVDEVFGISQDITERHRTERALAESETRFRKLVENSPYCIHEIDRDRRLISMNRAGLCMMGVDSEDDVVGTPYLDAVAVGDRPRIERLMRRAFDGEMSQFEFEAVNGLIFASSFVPIVDDDGRVVRLMGLTQDVTEQTRDKLDLVATRNRLERALRGNDLRLWDHHVESGQVVVTRFDARAGRLVREEVLRDDLVGKIHPDDRGEFDDRVSAHLARRTPNIESEHRMRLDDEGHRWALVQGRVVDRDATGRPLRVAGTLLDVHDLHEAQSEHRRLEARLQHAQKMESVGQLAGGIAHDFNNLLQVIVGHLSIAETMVDDRSELAGVLAELQGAYDRATQLTRQLLSFSRQEPTERSVRDLGELLRGFSRMVERVLPESIALTTEVRGDVPSARIDGRQLEQVLLNLCVNARDAIPGSGRLHILACRHHDEDLGPCAEIRVRDDGIGMDAETAARAFDPFFTTKGAQGGSGLGLAMVYGLVTQNDGRVEIDSEPGRGTTVTLRFPAADGERADPRPDDPPAVSTTRRSGTVLIVEDEPALRKLYERTLDGAGFRAISAADGVEGLELFREHRHAIVLLLVDAVMPRLGGQAMCERLLAEAPGTPILFTSGYHENDALSGAFLERHGLSVLSKPHRPGQLLEAIDGVLRAAGVPTG